MNKEVKKILKEIVADNGKIHKDTCIVSRAKKLLGMRQTKDWRLDKR